MANFGTLRGDGVAAGEQGLFLGGRRTVTNGGAGDANALIEGAAGLVVQLAAGTVTNFGEIEGHVAQGIDLAAGGSLLNLGAIRGATVGVELAGGIVTNGGGAVRSALIAGYATGVLGLGDTRVSNSGTIAATGRSGSVGVNLMAGGGVVNGSRGNGGALISGDTGVSLTGSGASVDNYGTILGLGDFSGFGVVLHGGETASNILAGSRIEGPVGVAAYGGGNTVFNAGTIVGNGTWAVRLTDATDELDVAAGAAFIGTVEGGGGTLGLTSGVGTLSGLMAGGAVTVTGSMAATTFHDFDTLIVGGTFRSLGDVSVAAGQTLEATGSLTLGGGKAKVVNAGLIEAEGPGLLTIKGAIQNTGTLAVLLGTITVTGAVTGAGVAHIDSGRLDFMASFTEDVTFTGASQRPGILELAQSQSYSGTVSGFSKVGRTFLDLDDIAFGKATTATYAGTKTGGTLTVTDGAHTAHIALLGDYRHSTFVVASDGNGGTKVHDPATPAPAWAASGRFIAAMAGLAGSGGVPAPSAEPWRSAHAGLAAPRDELRLRPKTGAKARGRPSSAAPFRRVAPARLAVHHRVPRAAGGFDRSASALFREARVRAQGAVPEPRAAGRRARGRQVDRRALGQGAVKPSADNLARLTALVAGRVEGFTALDWERDLDSLARALGVDPETAPGAKGRWFGEGPYSDLLDEISAATERRGARPMRDSIAPPGPTPASRGVSCTTG